MKTHLKGGWGEGGGEGRRRRREEKEGGGERGEEGAGEGAMGA